MTARFVVFEGPEGGGKTLQIGRLAERLAADGIEVVTTREPGGTRVGNAIREILLGAGDYAILPETETLLLAAARAQHVREVIDPALARGAWILCDRFVDSTYAYQGGGSGLPIEALRPIQAFATGGRAPDLRILLDLPVEVGLRRRHDDPSTVNRIDLADLAYHQRVRQQYLELAANAPHEWVIVDAAGTPDGVQLDIWRQLKEKLALA